MVPIVVESGPGGKFPLLVLLGQVNTQLFEGLLDVILVVAVWTFNLFGATGHSTVLHTVPVQVSSTILL